MSPFPEASDPIEPIQCRKPLSEETGCMSLSRVEKGGGSGSQVVKPCLPTTIVDEGKRLSHPILWPKPYAHRIYAQDQVVIHTARM
jgi:hypothetical protein